MKTENYPEIQFCFTLILKHLSHKYFTEIKIVVKTKLRVNCIFPSLNINIQCFSSKDFENVITFWLTAGFLSCSQRLGKKLFASGRCAPAESLPCCLDQYQNNEAQHIINNWLWHFFLKTTIKFCRLVMTYQTPIKYELQDDFELFQIPAWIRCYHYSLKLLRKA